MVLTRSLATLLLGACVAGCAPALNIISWEAGALAPRGARTIVLVDGEGAEGPRNVAARLLVRESRGGWFRVEQYADQVKLVLVNERAEMVGAPLSAIPDNALWGRVDVIEWDTEDTVIEEEDEDGNTVEVRGQRSDVSLQITIVDRDGKVLVREKQYASDVIVEDGTVTLGDPLTDAARDAIEQFLGDAAPKQVSQSVRLDDSDGGLRVAISNITNGTWTLKTAERKVRRYLKLHPNNAIATYNLAVLIDAQGRHDEAVGIYDTAMRIHTREYYVASRAGCARRATAKKAVFGVKDDDAPPARGAVEEAKPAAPVEVIPDAPAAPASDAPAAPAGDAPPPPSNP